MTIQRALSRTASALFFTLACGGLLIACEDSQGGDTASTVTDKNLPDPSNNGTGGEDSAGAGGEKSVETGGEKSAGPGGDAADEVTETPETSPDTPDVPDELSTPEDAGSGGSAAEPMDVGGGGTPAAGGGAPAVDPTPPQTTCGAVD